MLRKKNPQRQREIAAIATVLSELSVGETADYGAMSRSAGCEISASSYPLIAARRRVERETGMRFSTVRMVGVTKLSSEEIPGIGQQARCRVGRMARRQGRRLTHLSYNLPGSVSRSVDAERSLLGAIATIASTPQETVTAPPQTAPTVAERVLK